MKIDWAVFDSLQKCQTWQNHLRAPRKSTLFLSTLCELIFRNIDLKFYTKLNRTLLSIVLKFYQNLFTQFWSGAVLVGLPHFWKFHNCGQEKLLIFKAQRLVNALKNLVLIPQKCYWVRLKEEGLSFHLVSKNLVLDQKCTSQEQDKSFSKSPH